jgi:hypothetical protein
VAAGAFVTLGARPDRVADAPAPPRGRVCFCTMAIHAPYRQRARTLVQASLPAPWLVLTDSPADFADLPVRTLAHQPTGPMAVDYVQRGIATGDSQGAAAYHDKRFALQAALEHFETAIFLDADSRVSTLPPVAHYPAGLVVVPVVRNTIAGHLRTCGGWRLPDFVALARHLTGDSSILDRARWCHEACYAVTGDGREAAFFEAWGRGAAFMQARGSFSGEGGVMGLAAAMAGWGIEDTLLTAWAATISHEGRGPKPA